MATVHPGHGGGTDRPCMVAQRGIVLPRAAMAPGTDGLKQDTVEDRDVERHNALKHRPTGVSERLKTDLEGLSPAESDDAGGSGEVPKYYPQPAGTRPTA